MVHTHYGYKYHRTAAVFGCRRTASAEDLIRKGRILQYGYDHLCRCRRFCRIGASLFHEFDSLPRTSAAYDVDNQFSGCGIDWYDCGIQHTKQGSFKGCNSLFKNRSVRRIHYFFNLFPRNCQSL